MTKSNPFEGYKLHDSKFVLKCLFGVKVQKAKANIRRPRRLEGVLNLLNCSLLNTAL